MYLSSGGDTNMKLQTIRKNILHDVLKYNLQSYQQRRHDQVVRHSNEISEENKIIEIQQDGLRKEKEQNRLNIIRRRQMLKEEYQRQIREKQMRKKKQRDYDRMYANIQRQYREVSEQRRIYDIQKMFNRKSYQARLNDQTSIGPGSQRYASRLKTEPTNYNPESYTPRNQDSEGKRVKFAVEQNKGTVPLIQNQYRDSLDNINVVGGKNIGNNGREGISSTPKNGNNAIFRPPGGNQNFRLNYN